jgi:hypothetical protein
VERRQPGAHVGPRPGLLDRGGAELERLRVPDDELILTPPAIAADASVWLATGKALYRAPSSP